MSGMAEGTRFLADKWISGYGYGMLSGSFEIFGEDVEGNGG